MSPRKRDLIDADSTLEREHAGYRQSAFDYVCKLQDVHAQKQYEIIEPVNLHVCVCVERGGGFRRCKNMDKTGNIRQCISAQCGVICDRFVHLFFIVWVVCIKNLCYFSLADNRLH